MELPHEPLIDFELLGCMGVPLSIILSYLEPHDTINFASTNKIIKFYCLIESKNLARIEEKGQIDLDILPGYITKQEIDAVHRIFPSLTKITISLSYAYDHLLDELSKFEKLNKLSIYLNETDNNYNIDGAIIREITCRMSYLTSNRDALYSLLWQIRGTKSLSLYNGEITRRMTLLIQTRELETLKIRNTIIELPTRLTSILLNSTSLIYLKLITNNYLTAPFPVIVANNFINGVLPRNRLILRKFCFTMDQNWNIAYQNLRLLRHLSKLEIYYSVQTRGLNLDRLIHIAGSLNYVEVTFIEFVERYKIFNRRTLEITRRKSEFYREVIESMDKYMEIKTVDYIALARELDL